MKKYSKESQLLIIFHIHVADNVCALEESSEFPCLLIFAKNNENLYKYSCTENVSIFAHLNFDIVGRKSRH